MRLMLSRVENNFYLGDWDVSVEFWMLLFSVSTGLQLLYKVMCFIGARVCK